eukprot:TRINITY_DN29909_c0_g1_i1.p1 TRINITY_DN29909_c0_g1~~TRINITY_DN29909_c0_g1_i1.p1  ORF type:complete len:371 (-),score=75.39 TRINITY_DN29909_c0_g1_i1:296-1408(-)
MPTIKKPSQADARSRSGPRSHGVTGRSGSCDGECGGGRELGGGSSKDAENGNCSEGHSRHGSRSPREGGRGAGCAAKKTKAKPAIAFLEVACSQEADVKHDQVSRAKAMPKAMLRKQFSFPTATGHLMQEDLVSRLQAAEAKLLAYALQQDGLEQKAAQALERAADAEGQLKELKDRCSLLEEARHNASQFQKEAVAARAQLEAVETKCRRMETRTLEHERDALQARARAAHAESQVKSLQQRADDTLLALRDAEMRAATLEGNNQVLLETRDQFPHLVNSISLSIVRSITTSHRERHASHACALGQTVVKLELQDAPTKSTPGVACIEETPNLFGRDVDGGGSTSFAARHCGQSGQHQGLATSPLWHPA